MTKYRIYIDLLSGVTLTRGFLREI